MIALEVVVALCGFCIGAVLGWRSGSRPVPDDGEPSQEQDADQEQAPGSEYECGACGERQVEKVDQYRHDGSTVEIYRCVACESEGALVHHPDGHTSGRGILAEHADQRIYSGRDGARALSRGVKWLSTGLYGLGKRLFRGLKRLVRWVASGEHSHEKPCAEALHCEHEETTEETVPIGDAAYRQTICVECGALLNTEPASEHDLILAGDLFEGPTNRIWEVVDPWLPVEAEGLTPCLLLEAQANGGSWCVACDIFETWVTDGTFSPIASEDIAADGGAPSDRDGFGTVLNRLQTYNSALVWVHDADTAHLTYYDERTDTIDADALAYIQAQGFEVLDGGRQECDATGQKQAYLEVRRRTPGEEGGEGGGQR